MDLFTRIVEFFSSAQFRLIVNLFWLFLFVVWFSLVFWTYRDAKKRGALALYWATVSLLFPVAGWLIYLIVRPPEYLDDVRERELEIKAKEMALGNPDLLCPGCHRPVERDFIICPSCHRRLKKQCPSCGRALKISWTVCPYCQQGL